ncbi:hypothetical protein GCM10007276_28810 [Agaricicola taiwanensis]|uniref:Uncharacterized protein n=1 Tax=Agaricicola taiwanensis TaxID=591372 RepID=A0A8J2YK22_9RHOB|nr:hypothetical protein [Agaricicola taiwanensis]GGE49907.1 hypothetical protein GCM10007276_28810 [Agaricicola taiwanensis]
MWQQFVRVLLSTAGAALVAAWLIILLVDPLGISPIGVLGGSVPTEANRRFVVPLVVRSGDYDSYLVGTSTLHHVAPAVVEKQLGGHFANVAIHGSTPYEQRRVLELVFRQLVTPKMIVHGIDTRWCLPQQPRYHPESPLPEWLYDDDLVGHLTHVLNGRMLTLVFKRLSFAVGLREPDVDPSGYRNDLKDDSTWTAESARSRLWAASTIHVQNKAALQAGDMQVEEGRFPELDALDDLLEVASPRTTLMFVMMPLHIAALPEEGSDRAAMLTACKQRMKELARARNAIAVDYLYPSDLTRSDIHFWDHDHTRISFTERLADDLAAALQGKRRADDGSWTTITAAGS